MRRFFVCLIIAIFTFTHTICALEYSPQISTEINEKVYCTATVEDDFLDNSIIVVINEENSRKNRHFSVSDFNLSEIKEVKSLTEDISVTGENSVNYSATTYDHSLTNVDEFRHIVSLKIESKGKQNVLDIIKKIEKLDFVESAEPNYLFYPDEVDGSDVQVDEDYLTADIEMPLSTPDDSYISQQYALTKIQAYDAWQITTGSEAVRVGIIDSGISYHPDLAGNVVTGKDFFNNDYVTTDDPSGHGTHIAGIIGAEGDNGRGICGINWKVELVPLQVVIDDDSPASGLLSGEAIMDAINYARNNNIPIINCSFGSYRNHYAYIKQMRNYKGLIVCSAGNGKDHDGNEDTPYVPVNTDVESHDPSCCPLDNIISVASTDDMDQLAATSNYGATTVDLAAPGVGILSTYPPTMCGNDTTNRAHIANGYHTKSGTSMAAPHVTGVAALIKSRYPDLTATQIKAAIMEGVTPVAALSGKCVTGGRLNAKGALDKAALMAAPTILTGDFNGDGREDLALFESYPSADTAIRVRLASEDEDDIPVYSAVTTWWRSGAGVFDMSWVGDRLTAGDFDGDNQDEIAVFYGYADNRMNLIVFDPQSDNTFQKAVWKSYPAGSWEAFRLNGTITSGNFASNTGNVGKDEIVGVYQYAAGNVKFFMWQFSTVNSTPTMGHTVCKEYAAGDFSTAWMQGLTTAGDINDDGYEEYMVGYGYSDYAFKILYYRYSATSSTFNSGTWYSAPAGSYDIECMRGRFVFVNFSDVAYKEIGIIYRRNSGDVDFILLNNMTNNRYLRRFTSAQFNASFCSHVSSGDTDGDGNDELIVIYEFPPAVYRVFGYSPSGANVYD